MAYRMACGLWPMAYGGGQVRTFGEGLNSAEEHVRCDIELRPVAPPAAVAGGLASKDGPQVFASWGED